MIEELRKNIETEVDMLREIAHYSSLLESASPTERTIVAASLASLQASMKLVNTSIPQILINISVVQKLPGKQMGTALERIRFQGAGSEVIVVLRKEDKEKFIRELSINEDRLKQLKKERKEQTDQIMELQRTRGYLKFSNRLFRPLSVQLIRRYGFKPLALNIKKANFDILLESYISMMLTSALFSVIIGLFITLLITIVDFSLEATPFPFVLASGNYVLTFITFLWIPAILPPLTFWFLYTYPGTERSSIEKRIDQELPFAVIHMSAISGAGIEPTNIFKIIALSREYPSLRKEIRKVLNQINLYGYDLVTALNNVARTTPSTRLSELFTGISTTIHSGGELSNFFEKRAETLLVNYRLEREKFTKIAETFMDIYITVAIAAPMILLLVLMMLSLSNFDTGLSETQMTLVVIAAIGLVNAIFLTMLHLKQPKY